MSLDVDGSIFQSIAVLEITLRSLLARIAVRYVL